MRAKSQIVKRDDDFLPFQRWHIGHHGACNTCASTYICCPSEWKVRTLGMRRYQSSVHLNSNYVFHPSKVGTAFFLVTWRKQFNTASPGKLALHAKEIHLKDEKWCFVQRQPNLQRHILLCKRNGTTIEMLEIKMHKAVDMKKKYLTERLPCSQYLTSKSWRL